MQPNVIYLSDASFDPETGCAGIGIKNLFSGKSHSLCVKARNINEAEEFALIVAISHALCGGHRNCVFVYDNIGIDTRSLHAFYSGMFEQLQFMWFKREYLGVVDRLASQARPTKDKLPHLSLLQKHIPALSEQMLVTMFMPLTRGETYGFLSAISLSAPFYRDLPKGMGSANKMVLALLCQLGEKPLRDRLFERFGSRNALKHAALENFLTQVGFDESWIHEAQYECRGHLCA